jgi:tripartite-type tricarboxylate transporter receptor subunit TctC
MRPRSGRTPKDIVRKLSDTIATTLRMPENTARIEDLGMSVVASTPEELGMAMKVDSEVFGAAVKTANITIDN